MHLVARVGKEGTRFLSLGTDRHYQIHRWLCDKHLNAFSSMVANINANLIHRLDRQGMNKPWLRSRAKDRKSGTATSTQ
jgi:adenine C2-methylase RlmN of 23S rRNA A2503 and tRNA A37